MPVGILHPKAVNYFDFLTFLLRILITKPNFMIFQLLFGLKYEKKSLQFI